MRLRLKRPLFDGEKLHDAGVADVSDLLQPPRDAEVWDGKGFVPVPTDDAGNVVMEELESVRGEVPPSPEDEDDFDFHPTPKRGKRK